MSRGSSEPRTLASQPWRHGRGAGTFRDRPRGLSEQEAERRRAIHGPNRLPEAASRGPLARLLAQFNSLLIWVLLAAAVLAAFIGHQIDALVILAVVVVNAIIGFIQEGRAEQALAAIRTMIDPHASLVRDGRRVTVPADDIVPGDYVLLEAGDRVPADLRLVRARNLRVDEAILTGESVAVEKATDPVDADAPLGDRFSMAFSGTFVAAGHGAGVAVATGANTELGRISTLIGSVEQLKTPLIRQMDRFANLLTSSSWRSPRRSSPFAWGLRGYALPDAFMTVVGLAVAAIPEGLPAVITITLAIGVQRMAARKAIIRRLPAVEALGSVSVICSDKTGTLTRNEMMARTVLGAGNAWRSRARATPRAALHLKPTAPRSSPARPDACASSSAAPRCATTPNCARTTTTGSSPAIPWKARSFRWPSRRARTRRGSRPNFRAPTRSPSMPSTATWPRCTTAMTPAPSSTSRARRSASSPCAPDRWATTAPSRSIPDYWRDETEALAGQGQRILAFATKPMPRTSKP
jgi:magnesium-transporting ATPase (P-type)